MSALLGAALDYASRGWPVFPCRPREKVPATAHGVNDATTDAAQIRAWWARIPDANIGLACGHGLVVVDFDGDELPDVPHTLTVSTGRGRHVYLDPGGQRYGNRTKLGGLSVDVRGVGGYVVAPPSVHPSGAVYAFESYAELAPVPDSWVDLMLPAAAPAQPPQQTRVTHTPMRMDARERASRWLAQAEPAVSGQGGHSRTLAVAVAIARGFDLGPDGAYDLLASEWNQRCQPPWSEKDLRRKCSEAWRVGSMPIGEKLTDRDDYRPHVARDDGPPAWLMDAPPVEMMEPPVIEHEEEKPKRKKRERPPGVLDGTHEGIARHVVDHMASIHGPMIYDEGDFYSYSYGVWTRIATKPDMWGAVQALNAVPVGEDGKPLNVTKGLVESVLALAAAALTRVDFFAEAPPGLAFSDGFLTLVHGRLELVPHSPEHRCRHRFDVSYRDAMEGHCPRFVQALDEWGLSERQRCLIGEWIGLMMLGLSTSLGSGLVLVLVGEGNDGKSVLIETMEGIVPRSWQAHVGMQDLAGRFAGIDLVGKRLNTVADGSKSEFHDSAKLKLVTTGGSLRVEQKNQPAFNAVMRAAFCFSFNELPRFSDDSRGMLRRFRGGVVPFTKQVEKPDKLLKYRLIEEAHGIVGWAIGLAAEMIKRGAWTEIESDAFNEWRKDSNPVEQWLEERTLPGSWSQASACYSDYKGWALRSGYSAPSIKVFGARLGRLVAKKVSNGVWYEVEVKA